MAAFLVYLFAIRLTCCRSPAGAAPQQLVLPVLVLAIPPMAYIARLTRTYMLEVLQQDYIRTARAKGLRERLVIWRHALRNTAGAAADHGRASSSAASCPAPSSSRRSSTSRASAGSRSNSIFARDYPVTMAIVLLFTAFYAGINLLVDLLYGLIDPRIRLGGEAR